MKNTICYPLAKLGYKSDYSITEQGQIISTANQSQPQTKKKYCYSLKTVEGKRVQRTIKSLYRQAFNKEYSEDTIEDLPLEVWKSIDESGKYFISSEGRVKSYLGKRAKILKPYTNQSGYYRVDICLEKRHTYLVHQLVANAFIVNDDPERKDTIDHIDGDKTNNSANNLRWLSRSDNCRAYYKSLKEKGETANDNSSQPEES